ncbi:MAG TPA: tripartite tricarboxylate transporter TctB family protein, partial [Beijerinckiaceae bacterium]|nr:tripartite tricarboxylate transporter TctB family protein [Beijerinckiaceae bacterium]
YSAPDGPGPGFFPIWYGVGIIVLSLVLVARSLLSPAREDAEPADRIGLLRALGTWLAFATAVALLKPLGFTISFALLTFVIVAVVFRRPLVVAGVTALATAAAFYLTFPLALGVPLPAGPLGF